MTLASSRRPNGPVVFFSMPEPGHFQRLRSLIAGIAGAGLTAYVFTHRRFRDDVARARGVFVDLFGRYPIDAADDGSMPVPCRFVSFAGVYGERVSGEVAALAPSLIVHDTFAVIGGVVARRIGVPHVNVCAGHEVVPSRFLEILARDPRVRIADACWRAVDELRTRHGMADASPFSYVSALSPHLNIYCEPPEFLEAEHRRAFEPLAFYGSLPDRPARDPHEPPDRAGPASGVLNVYVSFGTVVWRYYATEALEALSAVTSALSRVPSARVVVSLGHTPADRTIRERLSHANVTVSDSVDQWNALQVADVFVTHHGLNSTHEAIFHGVPMLSYPFFWDQPALARKCQSLGFAVPLSDGIRGEVTTDRVALALQGLVAGRQTMLEALTRARGWELEVIAQRPSVLERMLALREAPPVAPRPRSTATSPEATGEGA